jgi:hypothetical protein
VTPNDRSFVFTTFSLSHIYNTVAGVSLREHFRDPDADVLTIAMTGLPVGTGLVFDRAQARLGGTPTNDDAKASPFQLTVTASDAGGLSAMLRVGVTIFDVNLPPVVVAQPPTQRSRQGEVMPRLDLRRFFSDPDGNALTFRVFGLPPGSRLAVAAGGVFGGVASNADAVASPFAVIVSASDGSDDEASLTFTVDVANVNDAPAVATQLPLSIVKVSEVFSLDVSASFVDPDGDALTFSLQQGSLPSGTGFSLVNGVFGGSPTGDDVAAGQVQAAIVASDGTLEATATLTVIIGAVTDSALLATAMPPVFAVQDVAMQHIDSAQYFRHPLGRPFVRFRLVNGNGVGGDSGGGDSGGGGDANGFGFAIDATSGRVSGTPTNAAAMASPLRVTIEAADAVGAVVLNTVAVNVANVNDAPVVTGVSIRDQVGIQGTFFQPLSVAAAFADPDDDALRYSLHGLPASSGFVIDAQLGTISGLPNNADAQASKAAIVGTRVEVRATDGDGASAAVSLLIYILDVNDPPVVVAGEAAMLTASAAQNDVFTFDMSRQFVDPDDDVLTFSAHRLPYGSGLRVDPGSGVLSGMLSNADALASPLALELLATDTGGASAQVTVTLIVANVNDAPVFKQNLAPWSATQGTAMRALAMSSVFTDPDGDALTFEVTGLPEGTGLRLNDDGDLVGTPTNADALRSPLAVTVAAFDPSQAFAATTLQLRIANVNDAPVATRALANEGAIVYAGDVAPPVNVAAAFADPDKHLDTLTYALSGLPPATGLFLTSARGVLFGQPNSADLAASPLTLTATVRDAAGRQASEMFTLTVAPATMNSAPRSFAHGQVRRRRFFCLF